MKRAVIGWSCLLLAAAPGAARAVDWQADSGRILGDPSFLPLAGQLSGSFEYTYSASLFDTSGPGEPQHEYDRQGNAFLPDLRYGITDEISVAAQLGWGNSRGQNSYVFEELRFPTGPFPSGFHNFPPPVLVPIQEHVFTRAIGADDPVFSATWRAVDQRAAPVSVDLTGSYSPDIFSARAAGVYQTGAIARGGQRGTVEAALSRQTRWLTLRVYGSFGYSGRNDVTQIGGFETEQESPHADYAGGLQSEVRLLPWAALNLGVQADRAVRYDDRFVSPYGTVAQTVLPGASVSPYVVAVVPLLRRRVVGELGYQHDFIGDQTVQTPNGDARVFDRGNNLLFARLLFVFGPP